MDKLPKDSTKFSTVGVTEDHGSDEEDSSAHAPSSANAETGGQGDNGSNAPGNGSSGGGWISEDLTPDEQTRLQEGREKIKAEKNRFVQSLREDQMKEVLRKAVVKYPGFTMDLLALMKDAETPRVLEAGGQDWCICNNCRPMETDQQRLCCGETPQKCISRMAYMRHYILNSDLLAISRHMWHDLVADDLPELGDEQRMIRCTAYRQFLAWQRARPGIEAGIPIPSCCVWRMREYFPDPRGLYTQSECVGCPASEYPDLDSVCDYPMGY